MLTESYRSGFPEPVALALSAIEEGKGDNLLALDLRGLSDAADFFIIASGTSDAHVRGIANRVVELLREAGHPANHVEGMSTGRWVLLDFVDIVVHLFHPETREYYRLERLWQDAPQLALES